MAEQNENHFHVHSENKAREHERKKKTTVESWAIYIKWGDGKEDIITEMPDEVANVIDNHLTTLEKKRQVDYVMGKEEK
jgi:hypothetical protein